VRAHLSRGRALDVYEVWSEDRSCQCVAKTLRPDRHTHRSARRRLGAEAELLLRLAHPHIVRAYEFVRGPKPVLVLETLAGATLAYIVKTSRPRLPLADVAVLGLQLSSAVAYIHRHGFLHLDLKPSNIVSEQGLAKVLDLSIARAPGRARKGVGSRPYMSPEQARGGRVTEAADVWGLGAVLYETAAGRRPFKGARRNGYPQLDRRADPVRTWRRIPRELADVIDSCLEPDAAGRPRIDELTAVLESFA
jgi:serine/threonine protein kinase